MVNTETVELQSTLQNHLTKRIDWWGNNGMKMNLNVTKLTIIDNESRQDVVLGTSNGYIKNIKSYKYLVVYVEDDLKMNMHLNNGYRTDCQKVFKLKKMRKQQ